MTSSPLVIIGMSGGVDSSVAAWLLQQRGYRVQGLFMSNWDEDEDGYCTAAQDYQDARKVCDQLGIPLHKVSFAGEYRERVFSYFLSEYRAGRTPNPDVLCNREIKFGVCFEHARRLGADWVATGHYARVQHGPGPDRAGADESEPLRVQAAQGGARDEGSPVSGTSARRAWPRLLKGLDPDKDQSYFLHAVPAHALARSLFPLGALHKQDVRRMARELALPVFEKKDSTGICFIGERPFAAFLARYLPARPGEIRTPEGRCLGEHRGLMYYTLGQRQGLGIGGRSGTPEAPWYVAAKDLERNLLIVVQGHDHPALLCKEAQVGQLSWIAGAPPAARFRCCCRLRYRQADQACEAEILPEGRARLYFDRLQRAVTPGQYAVFYDGEICLGGGVIEASPRRL